MQRLNWYTVNNLLRAVLEDAMQQREFEGFRLVGGTALSLQLGHRKSVDIDLFTDMPYGSVNMAAIEDFFKSNYQFFEGKSWLIQAGTTFRVGNSKHDAVKVDVYYTDPFIKPCIEIDNIRLAAVEDIAAMKLEVLTTGGRKKDFWDIHELSDRYDFPTMIGFHKERYPYSHDESLLRRNMINFTNAEDDLNPECLKGKYWELIKLDLFDWANASN